MGGGVRIRNRPRRVEHFFSSSQVVEDLENRLNCSEEVETIKIMLPWFFKKG